MKSASRTEDPTAPKNQPIDEAPHGGRNAAGDIVADATESSGQGSEWEASGDLTPQTTPATGEDYESGPGTYKSIPDRPQTPP